ncbi:MAG: winged helix-turn-helix domain-containing protein [Pirellulaceae bacterium]
MPIPDYQECMLPLLQSLADGEVHSAKELTQRVSDHFKLTDEDRQKLLPSGHQTYISNRVGWAKSYLKKAGLVANPTRGKIQITVEGRAVLTAPPIEIDCEFLKKYPSFVDFWNQAQKEARRRRPIGAI